MKATERDQLILETLRVLVKNQRDHRVGLVAKSPDPVGELWWDEEYKELVKLDERLYDAITSIKEEEEGSQ